MARRSSVWILLHVVWSTASRQRLLLPAADAAIGAILAERGRAAGCHVLAVGCASDHVHAMVFLSSHIAVARAVQHLKGGAARAVNVQPLLPRQLAWQTGYWVESVSPADLQPVRRYVLSQRTHHDNSHPAEQWQLAQQDPDSKLP